MLWVQYYSERKRLFAIAITLLSVLMVMPVMSGLEHAHAEILVPHFNLIISSVPEGADILIDGQYRGKTPKTIPITDLEMHSLRLVLSGYEDEEITFKIEPDETLIEIQIIMNKILPKGTIEVYTNIESATFSISGPATYSGSGTFWSQSNVPQGTYTITYGSVSRYKSPPSETKILSAGESITFDGDYQPKYMAGDSIDFGDGYIFLIGHVDPEGGEVSMELQLDDHTIIDKILRKGETYEINKYNAEAISINIVDIYHNDTGDYVDFSIEFILPSLYPHFILIIGSVPEGADILIDGQYRGKTPKTIPITDFEMHTIRLVLSEYEDVERTFKFEPDEGEKEMQITLNEIEPTPTPTISPTLTSTITPTPTPTPQIPDGNIDTNVIVALIGALATIIAAYLGYRAVKNK